jgi:microcystin-dependent protein
MNRFLPDMKFSHHNSTSYNTMKTNHALLAPLRALVLLACLLIVTLGRAADANPPERMTYQGYAADGNGDPLGNTNTGPKNYDMIFRIWNDPTATAAGNKLWGEQQTVTVDKGYFSVLLGEGSTYGSDPHPAISSLFTNTANASDRYVEITVKGIGAGSPPADVTMLPRLRLLTSPYAFLARNAVSAASLVNNVNGQIVTINGTNATVSGTVLASKIGIGTVSPGQLLQVGDVNTANSQGMIRLASRSGAGTSNRSWDLGVPETDEVVTGIGYSFVIDDTFLGNAPEFMIKFGTGNVGINTTNPTSKLYVAGDATITGPAYVGGALIVTGAVTTAGLTVNGSLTASGASTVTASNFVGYGTIPLGGIIMWSGATNAIPPGWALCNGTTANGRVTPDLRSRFVVGAGSDYAVGATGGSNTVTLTLNQIPSHSHTYTYRGSSEDGGGVSSSYWRSTSTATTSAVGGGEAHENRPPYYALCFIMRVQ